jgi:hypothetical protein
MSSKPKTYQPIERTYANYAESQELVLPLSKLKKMKPPKSCAIFYGKTKCKACGNRKPVKGVVCHKRPVLPATPRCVALVNALALEYLSRARNTNSLGMKGTGESLRNLMIGALICKSDKKFGTTAGKAPEKKPTNVLP